MDNLSLIQKGHFLDDHIIYISIVSLFFVRSRIQEKGQKKIKETMKIILFWLSRHKV